MRRFLQPCLEALEPRRCLSAVLVQGVIWVRGSNHGDTIRIANSYDDPTGLIGIEVAQNNRQWNFPGDAVLKISIDAQAGDDSVINTTSLRSHIVGGPGDDHIIGGSGNDTIIGGLGDDVLNGGDGGDRLMGGPGDDYLDGGKDGDALYGGGGNDNLVGGDGGDYMDGGRGDDYLDSRDCSIYDSVFGGPGHDTAVIDGYRVIILYRHDDIRGVESTAINEVC